MGVTQAQLKILFSYDPKTGHFTRLVRAGKEMPGTVAGRTEKNLYRSIAVDGRHYLAHRLVFLYMTGAWPAADVDHINRNRADNRWSNLREASRSLNMRNVPKFKNNKSGFKGVSWRPDRGVWRATIKLAGRQTHLGQFSSVEEANAAYVRAARRYFGVFAFPVATNNMTIKQDAPK